MNKVLGASLAVVLVMLATAIVLMGMNHQSQKIGLVDLNELVAESDAGKDASASLQGFIRTKENEVREQREALLALQENFKKESDKLSEAVLQDRKQEILAKSREFEQFVNKVRQEVREKDQTLSQKLLPDIKKIVRGIGHQEGYALIIDSNSGETVYHKTEVNLTDRVLERFNEDYNTGALEFGGSSQE